MKLNFDCVRDVLLYIEENTSINSSAIFKKTLDDFLSSDISNDDNASYKSIYDIYGEDVVFYHLNYCHNAQLIYMNSFNDGSIYADDLSPKGHDFLANIRNDNIWNNTKEVASKVGSKSLEALVQISSNVITTIIQKQFNL